MRAARGLPLPHPADPARQLGRGRRGVRLAALPRGRAVREMMIGIVSDTHDKVLTALHDALAEVEEILHAGDIASAEALAEIETIAPVTAVRGNMDERALADRLPQEEILTRGGVRIALVHGHRVGRASVDDLAKRFEARGFNLVVWGHIHEPVSEIRNGIR